MAHQLGFLETPTTNVSSLMCGHPSTSLRCTTKFFDDHQTNVELDRQARKKEELAQLEFNRCHEVTTLKKER